MYKYLTSKTMDKIAPIRGCEAGSQEYQMLAYGVQVIYTNVIKTTLFFAMAFLVGIGKHAVVFASAYGLLRTFSFGMHLENPIACTALAWTYYLTGIYLSIHAPLPFLLRMIAFVPCIIFFWLYAPAQTAKRPIKENQAKKLKRKSLCALLILMLVCAVLYQYPVYSNLVVMAAIFQTINLLPVTYKIFRQEGKG